MHAVITSGFPRSGNTYLLYALKLLYYPEKEVSFPRHTVISIEKTNKAIVTLRNPLDAISSWYSFFPEETIKSHINYYIRIYTCVANNLNKVVIMDFDMFTKDLEYIKDKVLTNFGISPVSEVTDFDIKSAMIDNDKEVNLPRNNKEELDAVKQQVVNTAGFDQCVDLYKQLQERHNLVRL